MRKSLQSCGMSSAEYSKGRARSGTFCFFLSFGILGEKVEVGTKRTETVFENQREVFKKTPSSLFEVVLRNERNGEGMVGIPPSFMKNLKKLQNLPPLEYHFFSPKDEKPMDGFCQPKPLLIHFKVNWRGEKKSERGKRRTVLCSMADTHAAVHARAATTRSGGWPSWLPDRTARERERLLRRSDRMARGRNCLIGRTRTQPMRSSGRARARVEQDQVGRRIPRTEPSDQTAPQLIVG